jgi:hypothetical protein
MRYSWASTKKEKEKRKKKKEKRKKKKAPLITVMFANQESAGQIRYVVVVEQQRPSTRDCTCISVYIK